VNPLVEGYHLNGLVGAPFDPEVVFNAGDVIRDRCGWHVAPVVTETLTVDSDGGRWLILPTRRLTAVTAIRDVTRQSPVTLEGWRWTATGTIERTGSWARWPKGLRAVEVDVTHGYPECPTALIEWAAELCRSATRGNEVRTETVGGVSVGYAISVGSEGIPVGARKYRVGI
jgi:hypothetical protein